MNNANTEIENNVIPFPGVNKRREEYILPDIREIADALENKNDENIQAISSLIFNTVIENMQSFNFPDPAVVDAEQDMYFLFESIKSLVSKYYKQDHSIQQLAEMTITLLQSSDGSVGYTYYPPEFEELQNDHS